MVSGWPEARTALKEWAVLVDAMARGDIIAMVRKGGIRDQRGGFDLRATKFFLYPTYFHENADDLAPRFLPELEESRSGQPAPGTVRIEYFAEGAISWHVEDLAKLKGVQHEAGLSWKAIEARFNYRYPGVYFIALRVSRLLSPVVIPERPRYGGCVSWLKLNDEIDVGDTAPVMSDSSFEARLHALIPQLAKTPPRAARL